MTPPAGFAIEDRKFVDYLLDLNHVDGGSKAKFFLAHGFTRNDPQPLAAALTKHASLLWPGVQKSTQYAVKHVLTGPLDTPNGYAVNILSVWKIEASGLAWFVTARPAK